MMKEKYQYAEVRQKLIEALKNDLMGPLSEEEVLTENPRDEYKVGVLAPQTNRDGNSGLLNEQELDTDIFFDGNEDNNTGVEDDDEPCSLTNFKMPSSFGISFYLESSINMINLDVSWGDYVKSEEKVIDEDGKEKTRTFYTRHPMKETVNVIFSEFERGMDYRLKCDPNVCLHIAQIHMKSDYILVTTYVINKRNLPTSNVKSLMFQVELKAYSPDGSDVFIAEHLCRNVVAKDEYYFEKRPIFGRGRDCAATWDFSSEGKTSYVQSDFIPEYEIPGVSANLPGFDKLYFSMHFMSKTKRKDQIIEKLNVLADSYNKWIGDTLINDPKMEDEGFQSSVGNEVVEKCNKALVRIREGILLLVNDDVSFEAFCFMNQVMLMQRSIANYSKKNGSGIECSFTDFTNYKNSENDFGWYPFQIAFILMNLNAIVDPLNKDHEVVDLLYFPTGGGKTEAYLGLMSFVIANRRLRANEEDDLNRDGGVTVILRYTLRLLTTQQRDRITRMIIASEMIRKMKYPKFGKEPISIGFWVGGSVTPNKFKDMEENREDLEQTRKARAQKRLLYRQLLNCPFCGAKLDENDFYIDCERKSVEVYCSNENCIFSKHRPDKQLIKIPVYLVDEEIYARCPTVILSTVDKFASLPWTVESNALFGRVDRVCERHGYISIGAEHNKTHRATGSLPAAKLMETKPFLPPELIIQDELHLITGPLGTIYGAYETVIDDLCSYTEKGNVIKPKYIVSTATIKNAEEQAKCLYGRNKTLQFPPNGFEIGDSFFIREVPIQEDPFRKYIGICAPGFSVKTILLRIYAILLQEAMTLAQDEKYADYIDPYYTLVGYFNSIRELGGAARLLQDDIPRRIKRIVKKYGVTKERHPDHRSEITSRMASYKIPENLKNLETSYGKPGCLDTAIATNMIAVGMDIDRLGLMVVTGQPKQNSEYIQATSRIGRAYPGLVVTLYNPYRPRDLSHYENFTGYHAQLYRFVEGTTATPFSARARDRVMHALVISALRLRYPEMAQNNGAANIGNLSVEQIQTVKDLIIERLNIIKPSARIDAENEIDTFIDNWKNLAAQKKPLFYYTWDTKSHNRLMNDYGESVNDSEKATLRSMRDVEKAANMYYFTED